MGKEDEVRLIAYRLWEEEGCLIGQDCEHWYRAEIIWERNRKEPVIEKTQAKQAIKQTPKDPVGKEKSNRSHSKSSRR
jgi:hypothetical protein